MHLKLDDTDGSRALVAELLGVISPAVETAAVLGVLEAARRRGAARRPLYDALSEAADQRRERAPALSDEDEEVLGDILDRLWGFCSKSRLLFPDLPPLSD